MIATELSLGPAGIKFHVDTDFECPDVIFWLTIELFAFCFQFVVC